jgi:hypothetical protein
MPSHEFLIDAILPTSEVHLIGGPSGAGKTTWLFQMLEDWSNAKPILGYGSNPCPWKYIAADRSMRTTKRTIARTGSKVTDDIVHSMLFNFKYSRNITGILQWCDAIKFRDGLLVIDGIQSLTPQGKINHYDVVAEFLIGIQKLFATRGITIIGTAHSTKVREDEQIKNPRQRILGSVAWGAYSETIILVEPAKEDNPACPERWLSLLPRNAPEIKLRLQFDSAGRLVEQDEDVSNTVLDAKLFSITPGTELTTAMIWTEWAQPANLSRRALERWLTQSIHSGRLERTGKGKYRRTYQN